MRARTRNPFLTVRTEGAILPADVLARIASADKDLDGLTPESYHLAKNERINEVATRAWNRLQGAWEAFREASNRLTGSDLGTTLTRERWLLILFQELGYGRLMTHRAWELDARTYPISHLWGRTPIHLVGCRVSMDKKQAGVAGAARVSPHSLVQEFLNRSDDHLWGIVSNGLTLRLLRDNVSLTRQAYVEFDLEAMMSGEAFSDFVLLFLVCHQSRVEVPEEKTPASCWLEQWHNSAAEQGIRALDELRDGVVSALSTLGAGFLAHPANTQLRQKLKDGVLSAQDYYRQLLRVVYRLLLLFVAEDRDLLYDPDAPLGNRAIYASYYATRRVRELAQQRRGTKHADLYKGLLLVFEKLREGCLELALPALSGYLFSGESTPDLDTVDIANRDLLASFRQLACTVDGDALRPIDYRNLGPEELGSVYESLLEMHPQVNTDAASFVLEVAAGSERKTTGSFYTQSSLVECLIDSALNPVLEEAARESDPEAALLALKVCDPACGSGHFLIAAAHRVARRLAAVRTHEDEPSPDATRAALRDVIGRCIYGVDINPMAVELCKVSLWMEAMEPGKTLGFLDHHIKCGNSLLGTTPTLLASGIPDDAFKAIEGDSKAVCKDLKAQNMKERSGQMALGEMLERRQVVDLAETFQELADEDDSSVVARERKARRYRSLVESASYEDAWLLADAWCAAFTLPKTSLDDLAVTHRVFRSWETNPTAVRPEDRQVIQEAADESRFFHWHLAFPDVLPVAGQEGSPESEACGWSGGFDCILGNPPWLSYSGRQKAPIEGGELALMKHLFPAIRRWPNAHGAFLALAAMLIREGGGAGMVAPIQVAQLEYYGETRRWIERQSGGSLRVVDAGEKAFVGVTQRTGLFSFRKSADSTASEVSWAPERAPWLDDEPDPAGDLSDELQRVLQSLKELPHCPKEAFSDPGVHTGNVSRMIVSKSSGVSGTWVPVREGRDIGAFCCGPPGKHLLIDPELDEGQYCTIRALERYTSVPIILRQTANRPIATRHTARTYFRNSILACHGIEGVDDSAVVAILNSCLIGLYYRRIASDSGQKAFPQVKVRLLRSIPLPRQLMGGGVPEELGSRLHALVSHAEEACDKPSASISDRELGLELERLVLSLYAVSTGLAEELWEAMNDSS